MHILLRTWKGGTQTFLLTLSFRDQKLSQAAMSTEFIIKKLKATKYVKSIYDLSDHFKLNFLRETTLKWGCLLLCRINYSDPSIIIYLWKALDPAELPGG